jgi:uncharacterized membrane protein
MDKRVSKLFRKNLFERTQAVVAAAVVIAMFYGFNFKAIQMGWIVVEHEEAYVMTGMLLALLEIMVLAMAYWFVKDAYDTAERVVRDEDFQKELDEKYGSTAK